MDNVSVYDVSPQEYNVKLAESLQKMPEFKMPEWAQFVKTSVNRMRPPFDDDFWHKRAASILRQMYIKGIIGVNKLRTKYGGKKDRGARPPEFRKGSGKIIRVILQQAEQAGLVEKSKATKKGRKLTEKGKQFLDSVAEKIKSEEKSKD